MQQIQWFENFTEIQVKTQKVNKTKFNGSYNQDSTRY